jgi:hypothetical protein
LEAGRKKKVDNGENCIPRTGTSYIVLLSNNIKLIKSRSVRLGG